ncbi:MAG TPA: hypothetical protein VEW03_13445 [Longimicrobiaceae bacterium]|nr:hypothetical protein [Longimicrobiaceae bacterium]
MTRLSELAREYEARHFPPARRLDLQGEGPETARERALRWIQSCAHEQPGADLLLVVERGRRPGARKGPVRQAVEKLLEELAGGLIDWWQPFAEGSLALRLAREPRLRPPAAAPPPPAGEGRTPETAGERWLAPRADIPPELLPLAERVAELRRTREGLAVGVAEVLLRQVWIEAQARAMSGRVRWEAALAELLADEQARIYGDEG